MVRRLSAEQDLWLIIIMVIVFMVLQMRVS
jgi:hypothetical protein